MKRTYLIVCLIVFVWAGSAQAQFEVDKGFAVPVNSTAQEIQNTTLSYFGTAPKQIRPAVGKGVDVLVDIALHQVIPTDFKIHDSGVLGKDKKVTWHGRKEWPLALEDITIPLAIKSIINWETKDVYLSGGTPMLHKTAKPVMHQQKAQGTKQVREPQIFKISPRDGLLSNALIRWGKKAGWQVSWESPKELKISTSATFTGDFVQVITSLVKSLATTDAPVQAVFYKNKVVRFVLRGSKIQ